MSLDRRTVLGAGVAAALSTFPWRRATAKEYLTHDAILATARQILQEHADRSPYKDYAAIVDYGAPSWRPRLHLVDVANSKLNSFLVAHGRGSDPGHTGWLNNFSNAIGSNATSRGAYLTHGRYEGKYGPSIRLLGLDAENSNALKRAIVIHPAWYVGEAMLKKYGKLGRSEGCFAMAQDDISVALARLGSGRLLYAAKL